MNPIEKLNQLIISKSEICMKIENYNELFSPFDPRPFQYRSLSHDFLDEAKRASIDKSETLDLCFMMKKNNRNSAEEEIIIKRLKTHFKRHKESIKQEIKKINKKGILMALSGTLMMVLAAYFAFIEGHNFFFLLLETIFAPAGLFTAWTGLDQIYYQAENKKPELRFYEKMLKSDIKFQNL